MTTTAVRSLRQGALERALQVGDRLDLLGVGAQAPRVRGEIHRRGVGPEQVVERRAAAGLLQAVDAAEAVVVEEHDHELLSHRDRGRDLRVHHEVAAVADHDEDLAVRERQLRPEAPGDLVSHARVAVLEVVAARIPRPPEAVELAGEAARGADDHVARARGPVDRADHLGLGGRNVLAGRRGEVDEARPLGGEPPRGLRPGGRRAPRPERGRQLLQAAARVGEERLRLVLAGVVCRDVQGHQGETGRPEERARPGGEVAEAGPDGQDDVGLGRERVGRGRARHADRAHVGRMVPGQGALAGLGLRDGHAVTLGEGAERAVGQRVVDPAARR